MRKAAVLFKREEAGTLTQLDNESFIFRYNDDWLNAPDKPAISLTLPKTQQEYTSKHLFPCFYNMLPEGSNKQVVCYETRIDPTDHFGLLMTTAKYDSIGAITVQKVKEP